MLITVIIDVGAAYYETFNAIRNVRPFCDKEELELDTLQVIKNLLSSIFCQLQVDRQHDYTKTISDSIYTLNCLGVPEEMAAMICNRCEVALIESIFNIIPQLDDENKMKFVNFAMMGYSGLIMQVEVFQ